MGNMREIRDRIKSINDIMKITNAMYLISSSKLKKAKKDLAATQPYFNKLLYAMRSILSRAPEDIDMRYFDQREEIKPEDRKVGYIVITADKGMCGSYNHNIIKLTEQKMAAHKQSHLYVMGQVGRMYFQRRIQNDKKGYVDGEFLYTTQNPTLYRAREIAEQVLEKFEKHELDEVYVIYTDMVNSSLQEPRTLRLLPFERKHFGKAADGTMKKLPKASFMPSPEEVMNYLIPQYAKGIIYGAMVEAFCCEQQSRMTAMDAATNSAKDMIKDLSLMYNRARQAAITQEITEVCGGAASISEE